MERWYAVREGVVRGPQRRKLQGIKQRASVESLMVNDDGVVSVGAEMAATGHERTYEIATDGQTRAFWTYA
jgi:hypothetical protein